MKKFDLRAKQIHLAAVRAQVSLVFGFFFKIGRDQSLKNYVGIEVSVERYDEWLVKLRKSVKMFESGNV